MAESNGGGFVCPNCGKLCTSKTVDSRATPYGRRRRRLCNSCGKRFTTVEYCVSKPKLMQSRSEINANQQT